MFSLLVLILLSMSSMHSFLQRYFSAACPFYDLILLKLDNTIQKFTDPERGMSQPMTSC